MEKIIPAIMDNGPLKNKKKQDMSMSFLMLVMAPTRMVPATWSS